MLSPVIAAGTALVGDFARCRLWVREDAVVSMTESLGFKTNTVDFRAEERVGFGVEYPTAFATVDRDLSLSNAAVIPAFRFGSKPLASQLSEQSDGARRRLADEAALRAGPGHAGRRWRLRAARRGCGHDGY